MKLKTRTDLKVLGGQIRRSGIILRRMERDLHLAGDNLPAELSKLHSALARCQESIKDLSTEFNAIFETGEALSSYWWEESPTEAEIQQLLLLNRQLRGIDPFLRSVADDVRPRLESKLADPNDPLYDYEIEARIDFILHENDPEYDDNDDNILTTRWDSLKHSWRDAEKDSVDFAESILSEELRKEPHCWRFHDLYDHDYDVDSPRLSFRDCLRVGKVWVDVQIWQQYSFDIP